MRLLILFLMTAMFTTPGFAGGSTNPEESNDSGTSEFTEQYVMLYYDDLSAASEFYGSVLGLKSTMDKEWAKLYQVTSNSFVGLIKSGGAGAYHKAKPGNSVMVSIVTEDIDTWYETVKKSGKVTFIKELANSENVPIRGFLILDPGGYTVEMFQWLK